VATLPIDLVRQVVRLLQFGLKTNAHSLLRAVFWYWDKSFSSVTCAAHAASTQAKNSQTFY
jgi:hypothetical protein